MYRKLGNSKQIINAYKLVFTAGAEKGKNCILVNNGSLEVLFNEDNALDIFWVKYRGINLSFLTKNGLNTKSATFKETFEGGFLYTCGMDNVSSCEKDKPIHGSLHHTKAEDVSVNVLNDKVIVSGIVRQSGLFSENIVLKRNFEIYSDKILINDCVVNQGYTDAEYCLLYHTNYGYPFLDENLILDADVKSSEGLTTYAQSRIDKRTRITPPVDGGEEEVFYNVLNVGDFSLTNKNLGIKVEMRYDLNDFPVTLQWKSMVSGDYALGIEPSTTRFDKFEKRKIEKQKSKSYGIEITFEQI